MKTLFVYIMSSKSRTLYVGVTNNLERRVWDHRNHMSEFTARYRITRLAYYESVAGPMNAIRREKRIKHYTRAQKKRLIESMNPRWTDLAEGWY